MNISDYDRVADELMTLAREIETAKRPGYTVGSVDVLANFRNVATRAGISAEQAWAVYFLKHVDAITSIMTRPDLPVSEDPPGRFADAVNYLRLGFALLKERPSVVLSIGRYHCVACNRVGEVVRDVAVTDVRCTRCDELMVPASGDEAA